MSAKRRHHPAIILFKIGRLVRNMIFLFLILFVFQDATASVFTLYGRYAFILYVVWSGVSTVLRWWTTTYALDEQRFHLQHGIFNRTEQTIPFSKVQNINRHTSFFHKVLGMTSLSFETGIAGSDASVKFEVVTKKEAARLESIVEEQRDSWTGTESDPLEAGPETDGAEQQTIEAEPVTRRKLPAERTVHFEPTKRDLLRASFTSFSFLLLIPLLGSLYYNVSEFIRLDEEIDGFAATVLSSPWIITAITVLLIAASLLFGIFQTFRKYGKYEIASDAKRIYIKKGILSEASFSIAKERVQAIEVNQSFIKRLLGLAEVKLISAGNLSMSQEDLDISSLYPFLPKEKAFALVEELLPGYRIRPDMERLPRRSFWVRMLKPSWFWLIATGALYFFKPAFFSIEGTWWIASALLLVLIAVSRILDFLQTRYCLNEELIQLKTGGFTTSLFVTKREKIVEIKITRTRIQRKLGLASLETVTRARPVQHSYLKDVPQPLSNAFHEWYRGRGKEIELE